MEITTQILIQGILSTLIPMANGGLGPPVSKQELLLKLFGSPCDCKGALQERCCFYANKSGIVRDKIKKLQEDLVKRWKELFENPLWSGLNGFLPYLLPLLGPLLGLLILLSLGPFLFNKLMAFLKQQRETIKMKPIQVHYHKLEMANRDVYVETYSDAVWK